MGMVRVFHLLIIWQAIMVSKHYKKKNLSKLDKLEKEKGRSKFCFWAQSIQVYYICFAYLFEKFRVWQWYPDMDLLK